MGKKGKKEAEEVLFFVVEKKDIDNDHWEKEN